MYSTLLLDFMLFVLLLLYYHSAHKKYVPSYRQKERTSRLFNKIYNTHKKKE